MLADSAWGGLVLCGPEPAITVIILTSTVHNQRLNLSLRSKFLDGLAISTGMFFLVLK